MKLFLLYISIVKKAILQYARELSYFLRAKSHYIYGRDFQTNPALFLRKRTHHLERYLFAPDSYSRSFAEQACDDIEKALSQAKEIPAAQEKWARKILAEYKAEAGKDSKTLCPNMINNAIRGQSPVTAENMMKLIRHRRSRRVFVDTPLTDAEKNAICEAAQYAPSACNRQSLYLIFVEDQELKEFVASTISGGRQFFSTAPCILLIISDAGDYRYPEERTVPFIDGAMSVQNIYLLCETMGLGCCCGSYSSFSCVDCESEVRRKLKIPKTHLIVASLAIGKSNQFVCEIPRDFPENRYWNDYYGSH